MKQEYKSRCDDCGSKGEQMHARIFYRKINKIWMYLCSQCWEAHRVEPTTLAKPKGYSLERTQSEYHGTYES
jgi:DNA-directed RNA polymerase subunit RPC12/RpoP